MTRSDDTTATRYRQVIDWFRQHRPVAEPELVYNSPFSLLVAVILSAQCTDRRVNLVTPALLAAYPTPQAMAQATADDLLPYISSVSYPNNKARHLAGMARMLVSDFGGEVPDTFEELTRLPGVGRKTAHVVLSVVWQKPTMAVDTHVFRVSHRLGLVPDSCTTPLAVERELVRYIAPDDIPIAHHWLILHGRYVCQARRPLCADCGLQTCCLHYEHEHPGTDREHPDTDQDKR